jgi:hypothetical protein
MKRTWVNYGHQRNWIDAVQGEGEEFLRESTQIKNIWLPYGEWCLLVCKGAQELDALKERLKVERVVNFFKSPAELQAQVIDSLSKLRQPNLTAFHYVSDIPRPPEPYIAHPYTLLQTKLVGRQAELNLWTDRVAKPGSDI